MSLLSEILRCLLCCEEDDGYHVDNAFLPFVWRRGLEWIRSFSNGLSWTGIEITRNWNRLKNWREQRRSQQSNHAASDADVAQNDAEEEGGDVPNGQLCVICLVGRKRAAFVPCGHLICCQPCAISVEGQVSPKCPLCRQEIRSSMRIYDC